MPGLPGTIVALASPQGQSDRALVRISGHHTRAMIESLCAVTLEVPRNAMRTAMNIGAPSPLPVLVLWSRGPRSYTGEDCAEVLCAGGRHVPGRVIAALLRAHDGARPAEPGEFTARAFLNGKLSAEASEGVQALVSADSEDERLAAQRLLSGETGEAYRTLADDLTGALALVEAGIDFVEEEDVVAIPMGELRSRITGMVRTIDGLIGPERTRAARTGQPRVVLAGAPSTGKSTLFNRLLGRERAVTHAAPGTTRDTLVEEHRLDGRLAVELADLAGLDRALSARSVADAGAQAGAERAMAEADVVVWCDPTGRFEGGGLDLRTMAPETPFVRVRTKGDLADAEVRGLSVCALDGAGIGALERAIADACLGLDRSGAGAVVARHDAALRNARTAIAEALGLEEAEEIAGCMRIALDALAPIAGHVHPDDVIGRIFATFCIGK